jgi:hypothetical protein
VIKKEGGSGMTNEDGEDEPLVPARLQRRMSGWFTKAWPAARAALLLVPLVTPASEGLTLAVQALTVLGDVTVAHLGRLR